RVRVIIIMPNEYYYFESDEVSIDRLQLEIELLKQLQASNLLSGIEWKQYDTKALKLFVKNGIKEAHDELKLRQIDNPAELRRKYEDLDFVRRLYIYEYLMIDRQNYLLRPLDKPLTSKRRRLSSTDDIPIILLTFCTLVSSACAIEIRTKDYFNPTACYGIALI
ncbi:unnamed protein product, partial [Didymodactylos carnosus]